MSTCVSYYSLSTTHVLFCIFRRVFLLTSRLFVTCCCCYLLHVARCARHFWKSAEDRSSAHLQSHQFVSDILTQCHGSLGLPHFLHRNACPVSRQLLADRVSGLERDASDIIPAEGKRNGVGDGGDEEGEETGKEGEWMVH